jgi:phage/plasmid-like protein (TIGR03299 family)
MNFKIFDLLEQTSLNWEVSKEQLFASDGSPTTAFGVFKTKSRQHIGTVSEKYEIYQNWQMAEALVLASEEVGVTFDGGGMLNGGKKVFLQASLPEAYVGRSGVKRNITALNSHDGSSSIGFGSTNTVIVCQNSFYRAYGELTKFRHTSSSAERVKLLAKDLNLVIKEDEKMILNFEKMAAMPLQDSMVEGVIRKIFAVEPTMLSKDIATSKRKRIELFANSLETEVKLEGGTVWGLFNAVTRYTNHVAAPINKSEYLMSGAGYKMSNMTYDMLVDLITV